MKNIFLGLLVLPAVVAAQSVGIGTNNPSQSSILEVQSTQKGLLIPRMTSAQRQAIPAPETGLVVYDLTQMAFFYYRGADNGGWVRIINHSDGPWATAGGTIFNTNAGNVGIGTSATGAKLTINDTDPGIQLRNNGLARSYLQVLNNDFRIGTYAINTTGKLRFSTQDLDRMIITETGNVAIGTSLINSKLQVNGDGSNAALRVQINSASKLIVAPNGGVTIGANQLNPPANGLFVNGKVGIGTPNATSDLTINSPGNWVFPMMDFKYGEVLLGTIKGEQNAQLDFTVRSEIPAGRLLLQATRNSFGVVIHPDYQVSMITTKKAAGYALSISGNVICEDLKIQDSNSWPDYVFESNYPLRSLQDVKDYISANKHLPGVPSAAYIEKNGIEVGEMTRKMMEKIEELTLYVLQLKEEIDRLKQ